MSKLGIVGATALSLALAVATPAFARGLRAIHVGAHKSNVLAITRGPDVSHCIQRWAYYNRQSGRYMGDDGQWRPCT
jgi:hypothetical protein